MIWFTSDHHFHHKNIVSMCNRPFSSYEKMEEYLIWAWNNCIKERDEVYYLGDFSISSKINDVDRIFQKLNGKIYILKGNHDEWIKSNGIFPITKNSVCTLINPEYELRYKKRSFILSHYAMRTWNKSHYGSIHLYGHSHGNLSGYGLSMDVGVDANNFFPIDIETVITIMEEKKKTQKDYVIYERS